MALHPSSNFTGKINAPTPEFPWGSARNVTTQNDGTGTPFLDTIINDQFGFFQSLLYSSGVIPNGSPDNVLNSQYLEALIRIIKANSANLDELEVSTSDLSQELQNKLNTIDTLGTKVNTNDTTLAEFNTYFGSAKQTFKQNSTTLQNTINNINSALSDRLTKINSLTVSLGNTDSTINSHYNELLETKNALGTLPYTYSENGLTLTDRFKTTEDIIKAQEDQTNLLAINTISLALSKDKLDDLQKLKDVEFETFKDAILNVNPDNGSIELDVINAVRDELNSKYTSLGVRLNSVEGNLGLFATQSSVNNLSTSLTNLSQDFDLEKQKISLKAETATVNALSGRVSNAEVSISALNSSIALKADNTTVTNLSTNLTNVSSNLSALTGVVGDKADTTTVTNLSTTLATVSSSVNSLEGSVVNKLNKSVFENLIVKPFDPLLTYDTDDTVSYNNLIWKCITPITTPAPWTGSSNWTDLELVADRLISAESSINIINDDIVELKDRLAVSNIDELNTSLTTINNTLTAQANDDIALANSITALDTQFTNLDTKVNSNYTDIVTLNSNVDGTALADKLSTLTSSIETVDGKVDSEITRVDTSISDLTTSTTSASTLLQSNIDNLNTSVTSEISRLDISVATLDSNTTASINTLQSNIETLDTTVTGEINRVDTSISTLSSNTTSSINTLQSNIDNVDTDLQTKYASLINLDTSLTGTALLTNFSTLQNNIISLSTDVTGEVARLDDIISTEETNRINAITSLTNTVNNDRTNASNQYNDIITLNIDPNSQLLANINTLNSNIFNENGDKLLDIAIDNVLSLNVGTVSGTVLADTLNEIEGKLDINADDSVYGLISEANNLTLNLESSLGQSLDTINTRFEPSALAIIENALSNDNNKSTIRVQEAIIEDLDVAFTNEVEATSQRFESIEANIQKFNSDITLAYAGINRVDSTTVSLSKAQAESVEILTAELEGAKAEAIEHADIKIGYCVDSNGNVVDTEDAVSCVSAGHSWVKAPLSTVTKKQFVSVTNGSASLETIGELFVNSNGSILAKNSVVSNNNGKLSGYVNSNNGTTSNFDIIADNFSVGREVNNVYTPYFYLDNNELVFKGRVELGDGYTVNSQSDIKALDGGYYETRYIKSVVIPSTPTGNTPTGWTTNPPIRSAGEKVWATVAFKNQAGLVQGSWSTPVEWSGDKGDAGLSAYELWLSAGNSGSESDFIEDLNGSDGVDGNTWHTVASGTPSSGLGKIDDFALSEGRYVYRKTSASNWTLQQDLKGPAGQSVTVVDNGNGTYTLTGANGSVTVSDGENGADAPIPTVVDNGNGTYSISVNGQTVQWSDGADGANGINGTNGADGYTPQLGVDYFYNGRFYSSIYKVATSTPSTPTGGSFNGTTETVPSTWSDAPVYTNGYTTYVSRAIYTQNPNTGAWSNAGWSTPKAYIIKGATGATGAAGRDATQYYTWVAYADTVNHNALGIATNTSDITGFDLYPRSTTKYIGIAYNQTSSTIQLNSSTVSKYAWSRYIGEDGGYGAGMYQIATATGIWSSDTAHAVTPSGGAYNSAEGDVVTIYKTGDPATQETRIWLSGSWQPFQLHVHGNALIEGTVVADEIRAGSVVGENATFAGSFFANKITGDVVEMAAFDLPSGPVLTDTNEVLICEFEVDTESFNRTILASHPPVSFMGFNEDKQYPRVVNELRYVEDGSTTEISVNGSQAYHGSESHALTNVPANAIKRTYRWYSRKVDGGGFGTPSVFGTMHILSFKTENSAQDNKIRFVTN